MRRCPSQWELQQGMRLKEDDIGDELRIEIVTEGHLRFEVGERTGR